MIALIASWVGLIIGFIVSVPFATFLFGSPLFAVVGAANIFFIIALPIIGFIQFAARYLFKRKTSLRTRNGMLLFWVLNVISFFAVGSFVARDFNQQNEFVQESSELNFSTDTIRLELGKETGKNSLIDIDGAKIVDDNLVLENVSLNFKKSKDNQFRLIQTHSSRGRNSKEIEQLTSNINYSPSIEGDKIIFPRDFFIQKGSKWRGQRVNLLLEVPEGKTVTFGSNKSNQLYRLISHHARHEGNIPSVRWHGEHTWTMNDEGWYSEADAIQERKSDNEIKDFKKVIVKGEVKVKIEKGDKYSVTMKGKERQLKSVDIEQIGEILEIKSSRDRRSSPVRVYITAPDLDRIDLEYTDDVRVEGFDGKKLDVFNEGRREVKVFVDVDSLYLNFKRNKSDIRGRGKYLKVKLDDRARMDGEHYVANNAFITARNAGKIRLEVVDTLRTDLTQGSRMQYEDTPKVVIDEIEERRKRKAQEREAQTANRQ